MISISVLITYYNEREMLTSCLESLRQQILPVDEILIYDDASQFPPDQYLLADLPCRVIRGVENLGPSHGRNVLLAESRGDYVHFHDSDDWFHPSWCLEVARVLNEDAVDVVFTEISAVQNKLKPSYESCILGLNQLSTGGDLLHFCIFGFMLVPSGTYKRDLVMLIGGYNPKVWKCEDYDFHFRLAVTSSSFKVIANPLICIRRHINNRSGDAHEVTKWAIQIAYSHASIAPVSYRRHFALRLVDFGRMMFQLGDTESARKTFFLASNLAPLRFERMHFLYRCVARLFGPMLAEYLGFAYRKCIPEILRR